MFDGLAWLMQIVLFLTLGLLVFPTRVLPLMGIGLIISLFLMFVARPVSVFLSLIPFKMALRRRFYISWVGLKGAVPIVFATYPLLAGIEKANVIFNIVFFISLTSILIQGTTLALVAKWLKVALPEQARPKTPAQSLASENPLAIMKEIGIDNISSAAGKKIVDLKFPKNAIIAMIKRDDAYITPNGSTVIEANDQLVVLSDSQSGINEVYAKLK